MGWWMLEHRPVLCQCNLGSRPNAWVCVAGVSHQCFQARHFTVSKERDECPSSNLCRSSVAWALQGHSFQAHIASTGIFQFSYSVLNWAECSSKLCLDEFQCIQICACHSDQKMDQKMDHHLKCAAAWSGEINECFFLGKWIFIVEWQYLCSCGVKTISCVRLAGDL